MKFALTFYLTLINILIVFLISLIKFNEQDLIKKFLIFALPFCLL